jgi:hypothetical protein
VLLDVAQRLLADPVQELIDDRPVAGRICDIQRHLEPLLGEPRREIRQRRPEPGRLEVRRVHTDDRRAQRPDAPAHGGGRLLQDLTLRRIDRALRRRREPHRQPGQLLHRAVVEIAGDPAALTIRHVERSLERLLAFGTDPLQPPREDPRERQQQRRQRDQGDHQHRSEVAEQLLPLLVDGRQPLIGLEQQRLAVGRLDLRVDLQQRPEISLRRVLRRAQVGDLGGDLPIRQLCQFIRTALVSLPDRFDGVGVEDRPALVPQLHAHDGVVQDGVTDDRGDLAGRHRVARQDPVRRPRPHELG